MFGVLLAMVCLAALLSGSAEARNVKLILPFATALEVKKIADRPTGAVKFFFGDQATPQILTKIGSLPQRPQERPANPTSGHVTRPSIGPSSL